MTLPQLAIVLALFGALCGYMLFVLVRAQVERLPADLHEYEEIEVELDGDDEDLEP